MSLRVRLLLLHPAKPQAVCSLLQEEDHSSGHAQLTVFCRLEKTKSSAAGLLQVLGCIAAEKSAQPR